MTWLHSTNPHACRLHPGMIDALEQQRTKSKTVSVSMWDKLVADGETSDAGEKPFSFGF